MITKKDLVILQKDRIITYFPIFISLYKDIQLAYNCHAQICDYNFQYENIVCLSFENAVLLHSKYFLPYSRFENLISKIVVSNYRKRSRVAKKFVKMFDNAEFPIYFGTLTFTDKVLDTISQKTRRVYVRRFLKNISPDYLANIDFGDLHEREHYHCIFTCEDTELFRKWKYGFVNVKQVRFDNSSVSHISKYVVKLVNHCVKGSAGFLISSRKKR